MSTDEHDRDRMSAGSGREDLSAMSGRLVFAGRYRLDAPIGSGGAATVFSATDRLLGREVAVKVFRADDSSTDHLKLQMAEARLLARLNHYALTTLLDAGIETSGSGGPRIMLVMERVVGADLRQRLRSGPLTARQVAYLGFDLTDALHYVHGRGYLHRDIKPANVLLSEQGLAERPRPKLADFGISSIIGDHQGEFTTGTAAYLAPEQVDGLDAVPATDVYALGLVLLEALTARVAFPGSLLESAFARLDRDPHIPPEISPSVREVLVGMTRRAPEERLPLPAAVRAFQDALVSELVRDRAIDPALLGTDEGQRVAAVHRYDVLTDSPDEAFDRMSALAARFLRAPMGFVSVVDAEHKLIRATHGLPEHLAPIDRNDALCAVPIATGRPISMPDVHADARVARNALLLEHPDIRSYAGAPLMTHDGFAIGAIGVFDRAQRDFTPDELHDLGELASMLMRELELRRAARRALFAE
ncbi:protein kinase [Amnibacterium sp. CER49]|uniref:protein kinase domain-containing protein n=1 Tax=Amnibacterium sp. CER49 TaxID=3039161 RepID=UPI0024499963|nr:protein kinase [Amnibacterium sp. CER49]MDH2445409.1 protein kinase [Amnibacterium sp. CER49]